MSSNLVEFVLRLNRDPDLISRFDRSPEAAIEEANLSYQEKEILRSGDPERIRAAIAEDLGIPGDVQSAKEDVPLRHKLDVQITIGVTVAL